MSADRIRLAIVGAGHIARSAHVPALAHLDDFEIVAVCDPGDVTGMPHAPRYASIDELLRDDRPDAALVLAPQAWHAPLTGRLLEHDVAVLCEKPFAQSAAQAENLVDLAIRREVPLLVGFNRRHAPIYRMARSMFQERRARIGTFIKTPGPQGAPGNADTLVHMLDLACFFFGEWTAVEARSQVTEPPHDDSLGALVHFESGAIATIAGSCSAGVWTEFVQLHGDGRTITAEAPDRLVVATGGKEQLTRLQPSRAGFYEPVHMLGFVDQLRAFATAVRAGRATPDEGLSGLRTQRLLDSVLERAGLGASNPGGL